MRPLGAQTTGSRLGRRARRRGAAPHPSRSAAAGLTALFLALHLPLGGWLPRPLLAGERAAAALPYAASTRGRPPAAGRGHDLLDRLLRVRGASGSASTREAAPLCPSYGFGGRLPVGPLLFVVRGGRRRHLEPEPRPVLPQNLLLKLPSPSCFLLLLLKRDPANRRKLSTPFFSSSSAWRCAPRRRPFCSSFHSSITGRTLPYIFVVVAEIDGRAVGAAEARAHRVVSRWARRGGGLFAAAEG